MPRLKLYLSAAQSIEAKQSGACAVISFNLNGMEKIRVQATLNMLIEFVYAVLYGDILMHLSNQVRP